MCRRWIGQFEPRGRSVKLSQGTSTQGEYYVVDITGTYNMPVGPPVLRKTEKRPGSRVLAAIVRTSGGDYFF